VERFQRAILTLQVLRNGLTSLKGDLISIQVKHFQSVIFKEMLRNDINAIISELMFSDGQFLQPHVVEEHLPKVDCYRLALCLVHWVVNVQLFQSIVALIEDTKDSNNSIMINLVIAEVETQQFIMGEK